MKQTSKPTSNSVITVTSPLLPNLEEFNDLLKQIWDSRWITNMGQFHNQLEKALADYLHVPYVCLFTNGTLPLMTALQALDITGEVITTPYSFVATTHSIWWNGCKPVFVDIDPNTGNIDPDKIEAAITPLTSCIMPVHCYGNPCDTNRIQEIADKHGLKVIYDAAHAFGVEVPADKYGLKAYDSKGLAGIMNAGDISTLSFHATKVYNTIEGGAMVVHDQAMKKKIDSLKNFGIVDEVTVDAPGINGKIDEMRSAYGLINLKQVDSAIEARKRVAIAYRKALKPVRGVTFFDDLPGVHHNYSYFPIFIDAGEYGHTRDELYYRMKENNVLSRRYFYPLISNFPTYSDSSSASKVKLPLSNKMAEEVLCLPMHHALTTKEIINIIDLIKI